MKRVQVLVEKFDRRFNLDYDNIVTRDEVEHEIYAKNPDMAALKEIGDIRSKDFYLTWYDLDIDGNAIKPDLTPDPVEEVELPDTLEDAVSPAKSDEKPAE